MSPTGLLRQLVSRIEIDRITIRFDLNRSWLVEVLGIRLPKNAPPCAKSPINISIQGHSLYCGMPMKIVLEKLDGPPVLDPRLVHEVQRAIRWLHPLSSGEFPMVQDPAKAEECCPAVNTHRIRLAFLAPDIVEMILAGKQPRYLTIARLKRACPLPLSWREQRALLLEACSGS